MKVGTCIEHRWVKIVSVYKIHLSISKTETFRIGICGNPYIGIGTACYNGIYRVGFIIIYITFLYKFVYQIFLIAFYFSFCLLFIILMCSLKLIPYIKIKFIIDPFLYSQQIFQSLRYKPFYILISLSQCCIYAVLPRIFYITQTVVYIFLAWASCSIGVTCQFRWNPCSVVNKLCIVLIDLCCQLIYTWLIYRFTVIIRLYIKPSKYIKKVFAALIKQALVFAYAFIIIFSKLYLFQQTILHGIDQLKIGWDYRLYFKSVSCKFDKLYFRKVYRAYYISYLDQWHALKFFFIIIKYKFGIILCIMKLIHNCTYIHIAYIIAKL